ncbi:MAG: class I SAM-dependent methyltransferase [Bacteroidales bacterium]|jgi:SAM-dependent methyltransferase
MPEKLSTWINSHQFPEVFYRFPGLLPLQWFTSRVLYHRCWLIRREVNRELRKFSAGFAFLDAGCGAGDFLIPFARKFTPGWFTGLDQSPGNIHMINYFCRKKRVTNVSLLNGDIMETAFGDLFDVILCASVLQYLDNYQQVLDRFAENLKPGGHLIIYVPVNYHRRIPGYERLKRRFFREVDYECGKPFRNDLSFEGLNGDLREAGFTVTGHRSLYGPVGQIAYEISSLALLLIQKVPWIWSGLFTLIYFVAIHPFILLMLLIDFYSPDKQGNGLLITAARN